jgi:hypothetical protein
MRGQSGFNVMASNINATRAMLSLKAGQNKKWKLCWGCQKEKPSQGSHISMQPGLFKFVCKDCLDARAAKKAGAV